MSAPNTYGFASIVGTIVGPGGLAPLGASAGPTEEGITIEQKEEQNTMTGGADGSIMHSLHAFLPGRVTVRLLKTSPINAILSAMYNLQRLSPASWGINTVAFLDVNRGDVVTLNNAAFTKQPTITYDKEGKMNEWVFDGLLNQILGTGVPNVNT